MRLPDGRTRNAVLSDAHEIMLLLERVPVDLLSLETASRRHTLRIRRTAKDYAHHATIELGFVHPAIARDVSTLRSLALRTLAHTFDREDVAEDPATDDLATIGELLLAAIEQNGGEPCVVPTIMSPSPWNHMTSRIRSMLTDDADDCVSSEWITSVSRHVGSEVRLNRISDDDAALAVSMQPRIVHLRRNPDAMERIRAIARARTILEHLMLETPL